VQVRITEDRLTTPIAADGLVMNVANAVGVSGWYAKWFGAKLNRSSSDTTGEIPGFVSFSAKPRIRLLRPGGIRGLLGFEVKDLQDFVKDIRPLAPNWMAM
jgi:hypothetical protein